MQLLLLLTRYTHWAPLRLARLSRWCPLANAHVWAARLACWLAGPGGVTVDESYKVFNIECRVRRSLRVKLNAL